MSQLGEWITENFKTQAKFGERIGVAQGRVSKWVLGTEGITETYESKIRKAGYKGLLPQQEAKQAAQEAPAAGVSREDHWKLIGRVEALERALERLAEGFRHHMTKEPDQAHPQAPA